MECRGEHRHKLMGVSCAAVICISDFILDFIGSYDGSLFVKNRSTNFRVLAILVEGDHTPSSQKPPRPRIRTVCSGHLAARPVLWWVVNFPWSSSIPCFLCTAQHTLHFCTQKLFALCNVALHQKCSKKVNHCFIVTAGFELAIDTYCCVLQTLTATAIATATATATATWFIALHVLILQFTTLFNNANNSITFYCSPPAHPRGNPTHGGAVPWILFLTCDFPRGASSGWLWDPTLPAPQTQTTPLTQLGN